MTVTPKSVYVKTYGCQMNVYDSERMRDTLKGMGYAETPVPDLADLVIFNTCHIREHAAEKVYSELGRMKRLKKAKAESGGEMLVAVAGCVAQAEGAEIIRRAKTVDLVFGPQTYHRLPDLIARRLKTGDAIVETDFPAEDKFVALEQQNANRVLNRNVSAFLTVQEGCDKFCSFCVVPYTRGAEFSRPPSQIEREARRLADAGVREITLLGQNVNAYHGEGLSLPGLIAKLSHISGIKRLRYTTSHPRDMDEALIEAHASNPKLMPFLHLPVQSGSDRILKAMNRGHGTAAYMDTVAKVRAARPDMALSGDFIVGFPGETDADFEDTLTLIEEVGYASAYCFKYSPRPGTPAAEDPDQVPDEVVAERLARIQALIHAQQTAFNRSCVGRSLPVLLEKPGREPSQLMGRSPYLQPVHVNGQKAQIGAVLEVKIDSVGTNSLSGHIELVEA
ncbi:MAG TPA: tRNA (N6-isopentenyl adenosine(37)-C2)-methylthiotransferase MiaB [Aestuariivirga sp.]|nr:tRNA (N6-isopentenyl adenosine(37)-C2)-methylthiotransferase MiaB [Aestuariivirga sp.]